MAQTFNNPDGTAINTSGLMVPSTVTGGNKGVGTINATQIYQNGTALMTVGTWTPAITFSTPGNLNVVYSLQEGNHVQIGSLLTATFGLSTTTFTHSTAAGNLQITGLPFPNVNPTGTRGGALTWSGITKAGYTQIALTITSSSLMQLTASGSGLSTSNVGTADAPSGGNLDLRGTVSYFIA